MPKPFVLRTVIFKAILITGDRTPSIVWVANPKV